MTVKLLIFLAIGTIAMAFPILFVCKKYQIDSWKGLLTTVALTVVGAAGTFLMFWFENGHFGGLSFYGAVFLVPAVFILPAIILKISYGNIMDMCAVGECIMLALMKVHCMLGGCCLGRILFTTADGKTILFPSRTVELLAALAIFCILLYWAKKEKHKGELYIWYLILYGSSRFVLNFFRAEWQEWTGSIPMGTIWSVLAILLGIVLIFVRKKQRRAT